MKKTKVEIIPMIDTMFFLLVFFILSSVGALKLQGINLQMPKGGSAQPPPPGTDEPLNVMINIKPDGRMFVGAKPVPVSGGIATLIEQQAIKDKRLFPDDRASMEKVLKKAVVIVNADPKASHELVIKAIDDARGLKRQTPDSDTDATRQEVGNSLLTQFALANSAEETTPAPTPGS
ncbi:MAG: biopolymer transporter ExbD [Capsulimonadales bacterium]|nr:biopolymer transporter ExbD [Capsulimonadales bacterium]